MNSVGKILSLMGLAMPLPLVAEPPSATAEIVGRYAAAASFRRASLTNNLVGDYATEMIWAPQPGSGLLKVSDFGNIRYRVIVRGEAGELLDPKTFLSSLQRGVPDANSSEIVVSGQPEVGTVAITLRGDLWWCAIATRTCVARSAFHAGPLLALAPSGSLATVATSTGDLRLLRTNAPELRLTNDAGRELRYGSTAALPFPPGKAFVELGQPSAPSVLWSPDERWLLTVLTTFRGVRARPITTFLENGEGGQPVVHYVASGAPGDAGTTKVSLVLFDTKTGERRDVPDSTVFASTFDPIGAKLAWWSADGASLYFIVSERGMKRHSLRRLDLASKSISNILIEDGGDAHAELSPNRYPPNVAIVDHGRKLIWYSERDGWGHLYLYSLSDGHLIRQITSGPWVVRRILAVNDASGTVYVEGAGRERDVDPYLGQLYAVAWSDGRIRRLTQGKQSHKILMSPESDHYIDLRSDVGTPTVAALHTTGRSLETIVAQTDISRLEAMRWTPPKRFTVMAADGKTTLYGTMFFPLGFNPSTRYPLLDHIYPGPQIINSPWGFLDGQESGDWIYWTTQSMAALGTVAFTLDARGTPMRSRAFHRESYGIGRNEVIADHAAAIRQLQKRLPFAAEGRAGIFGHSAGGSATMRAMLLSPDVFTVGIASAGDYDQRLEDVVWGERYVGLMTDQAAAYPALALSRYADRLAGKLMIMQGTADTDVNYTSTMQMIDALIKANKDFDLVLLPDREHGSSEEDAYFIRRRWDFITRHLIGDEPPPHFRLQP